jgi:hypothetical protein
MEKCTAVGRVSAGTEALTDPIGVRRTAKEYRVLMVVIFLGSSVGFTDAAGLPLDFKITKNFMMTFNYIFNQYRICTMEFVSSLN